jgi:HAD superfamily hydrolase (TIGR01509 family)
MPRSLPFDAVLWDIDGTLADSEPVHELSFLATCGELGLSLPDGFQDELLGKSEETTHAALVDRFGLALAFDDWVERRTAAYLARIDQVRFHPRAQSIWERLAARGVAQATVSNSNHAIVRANLARLGLDTPDLVSISRDDVVKGKPHPEPYLRAAELLGMAPARAVVIEDSATGLAAAVAAGMGAFMMPEFTGAASRHWQPLGVLERLLG